MKAFCLSKGFDEQKANDMVEAMKEALCGGWEESEEAENEADAKEANDAEKSGVEENGAKTK